MSLICIYYGYARRLGMAVQFKLLAGPWPRPHTRPAPMGWWRADIYGFSARFNLPQKSFRRIADRSLFSQKRNSIPTPLIRLDGHEKFQIYSHPSSAAPDSFPSTGQSQFTHFNATPECFSQTHLSPSFAGENLVSKPAHEVAELQGARAPRQRRFPRPNAAQQE